MEATFSTFVLWPLVRLVGWLVLAPLAGLHLLWRCAFGGATGVFAPPLETAVPAAYAARSSASSSRRRTSLQGGWGGRGKGVGAR